VSSQRPLAASLSVLLFLFVCLDFTFMRMGVLFPYKSLQHVHVVPSGARRGGGGSSSGTGVRARCESHWRLNFSCVTYP